MKNILFKTIALLLFATVIFTACQKESVKKTAETQQKETQQLFAPLDIDGVTSRSACPWAVIPAGSVDVLQQAVDDICDDGIIYLKGGMHTENHPVTVSKPVKIIGAEGAVLKIKSEVSPGDPVTGVVTMNPAIHVLNAPATLIQDLEIQPLDNDGATAVLFENSHGCGVMRCKMTNFQFGILAEKSDRLTIMFNTIVGSGLWLTGDVTDTESIIIINGKSAYIADNEISNSVFGLWATDQWGTCERNNLHDNWIGLLLCNAPQYLELPDGRVTGSLVPCNGWKVRNNLATDNFHVGYVVTDNANNNFLIDNDGHGNADYDMELTTETLRFGLPIAPESYENTVIAGAFPGITIKDCGSDNSVTGGVQIDITTDPCD